MFAVFYINFECFDMLAICSTLTIGNVKKINCSCFFVIRCNQMVHLILCTFLTFSYTYLSECFEYEGMMMFLKGKVTFINKVNT